MKKLISAIVLGVLAVSLIAPLAVSAQIETEIPEECDQTLAVSKLDECTGDAKCDPTAAGSCGFCCMMNTIFKITDWLFIILMLLVTVFIIYGGFVIITASGDPEKAGKGRQILTYAIVGLAIALLAKVIPSVVRFIIGV